MFDLFGAPCLITTCIDRTLLVEYPMLDVRLVNQTICLLAHDKGLETCMLGPAVRNPKVLREHISIPEDKLIAIGTAIGYPDWY